MREKEAEEKEQNKEQQKIKRNAQEQDINRDSELIAKQKLKATQNTNKK